MILQIAGDQISRSRWSSGKWRLFEPSPRPAFYGKFRLTFKEITLMLLPSSGLFAPGKKDIAMQLVSAAENSSISWRCQYRYIEYNVEQVEEKNRGYTAGIIGFTAQDGDLLEVVKRFEKNCEQSGKQNLLSQYIEKLEELVGVHSQKQRRLGEEFFEAWQKSDSGEYRNEFREAQDSVRDEWNFDPAVSLAQRDGLGTLGQFIYYDAVVMHGRDQDLKKPVSFDRIRAETIKNERTPAKEGNETKYLSAFMATRVQFMRGEEDHKENIDRVDDMQRVFLDTEKFELDLPLKFKVNKTSFEVTGVWPDSL
jgi:chitosanase